MTYISYRNMLCRTYMLVFLGHGEYGIMTSLVYRLGNFYLQRPSLRPALLRMRFMWHNLHEVGLFGAEEVPLLALETAAFLFHHVFDGLPDQSGSARDEHAHRLRLRLRIHLSLWSNNANFNFSVVIFTYCYYAEALNKVGWYEWQCDHGPIYSLLLNVIMMIIQN